MGNSTGPVKIEIYQARRWFSLKAQSWRWRAIGINGEKMASGEGYSTQFNVERAVRRLFPDAKKFPMEHVAK